MKTKQSKVGVEAPPLKVCDLEKDMRIEDALVDVVECKAIAERRDAMPAQPDLEQLVQIAARIGQGKDLKERADAREIARQALQLFRECRNELAESVRFMSDGIERSVARMQKGKDIPVPKRKLGTRFPAPLKELKQAVIGGKSVLKRDEIWTEFVKAKTPKTPTPDHFSKWTDETEISEMEWRQGVGLELWEWVKQRAKERKAEGQKTGGKLTGEARKQDAEIRKREREEQEARKAEKLIVKGVNKGAAKVLSKEPGQKSS